MDLDLDLLVVVVAITITAVVEFVVVVIRIGSGDEEAEVTATVGHWRLLHPRTPLWLSARLYRTRRLPLRFSLLLRAVTWV